MKHLEVLSSQHCEIFFLKGAAFDLPTSWANMDEKENIKVVLLQKNDPDYKTMEKSFNLGTGSKFRIVQVSVLLKKKNSDVLNT